MPNIYDYAEFAVQKGRNFLLVISTSIVEETVILWTLIYILSISTSVFLVWLKILESIPSGEYIIKLKMF